MRSLRCLCIRLLGGRCLWRFGRICGQTIRRVRILRLRISVLWVLVLCWSRSRSSCRLTTMTPFFAFSGNAGSNPSRACLASSVGSINVRYFPGRMTSVSTLSPNFMALPGGFHAFAASSCRGSVILPVIAEAATVAGDARKTLASVLPILPMKFRFEVLTHVSPAASNPMCPPKHGPHVEAHTMAPESVKISMRPSLSACEYTSLEAGMTSVLTSSLTFLPFSILAARSQVLDSAVCARAYEGLVDSFAAYLRNRFHLVNARRQSNLRSQIGNVNVDLFLVFGVRVAFQGVEHGVRFGLFCLQEICVSSRLALQCRFWRPSRRPCCRWSFFRPCSCCVWLVQRIQRSCMLLRRRLP